MSTETKDWLSDATESLQSFLPLAAGLYYLVASAIDFALPKNRELATISRTLRNGILCCMGLVLVTYGIDAALLIGASIGNRRYVSDDSIVFTCGSLLLWTTLLLGFSNSTRPIGFPCWGCWIIYLGAENALTVIRMMSRRFDNSYASTRLVIQVTRFAVLLLLCAIPAFKSLHAKLSKNRVGSDDEESCPLLNGRHRSGRNSGYSTIGQDDSNLRDSGEDEKRKKSSDLFDALETLRGIVPFLWPQGKVGLQLLYVGVGFCLITDRVLNILVPIQLGVITDKLDQKEPLPWKEILVFMALRLLDSSGGIPALRAYLWLPLENHSYKMITTAAFNQIMDLSSDFHDNKSSGKVWQSVSRGISIRHVVRSLLFQIGPMIADLFLAVTVLHVIFGPYMGMITAAVIIFFLWSSGRILSKQKSKRREWISNIEKEHNILCESTTHWQTVSYFNRIEHEKCQYSAAVQGRMKSEIIFKRWSHAESVVQSLLLTTGLLGACFLAAYQVSTGSKPVGNFVMLLGYWGQLSGPLQFFASGFNSIALDLVNAEELFTLLKRKPLIRDKPKAVPLKLTQSGFWFNDVKFSYDGRRQILKGVTFQALPGQTVALVGETGGGKSTILKLLFRFYEVDHGSIEIDGQDIRNVTLESLRDSIGIVPQDPALFNDTILNNIRYARESATDEEIYEACKAVTLHEKFLGFPDGYQTKVGERGIKLSGGELQRVAIARAIVKNPRIVLLDEATSSVDSDTETQIQQSLNRLTAGRTAVVIAHRLSTIINADKILAIKGGKIVEQGTHRDLVKRQGYYRRLWSQQTDSKFGHSPVTESRGIASKKAFLDPDAPEFVPRRFHV